MSEMPNPYLDTYRTQFGVDVTREPLDDAFRFNAQEALTRATGTRLAIGPTGWSLRGEAHAELAHGVVAAMNDAARTDPSVPQGVGPVAMPVKTTEIDETWVFVASNPGTFKSDAEYRRVCEDIATATSESFHERGLDVRLPI